MFGRHQKTQTDIKKSTQKLLDSKKDVSYRLKHLKVILENSDGPESKAIFSTHYSHIYHLVYEGILAAEASLKQKGVHRAQREELESVVHLLEKIIVLLPDLLHCRWQLHSLSRLMAKLNHPMNSVRLRREGMRLFLMWYQCLGTAAPNYVHSIYASLVPGLQGLSIDAWPPPSDPSWGISPLEITAVLPASSSEKQPDDVASYFLECMLDFMVSQAPKIHWNDGFQMWAKSIDFLYERFKEFYLPRIFPGFQIYTDIYKPNLDLPELRPCNFDSSQSSLYNCQVVIIKWIANYSHSVYRSSDCFQQPVWNPVPSTNSHTSQLDDAKTHSTPPSSMSGGDRDSITSYTSIPCDVDANVIGKDVILGTRSNINLVHEIFRRALLLHFVHTAAIRRVICVYKDWIQINVPELPVFMLEPEHDEDENVNSKTESGTDSPRSRLRTDSYYGAIGFNANNNREEYLSQLRAGAQKVLRVFFCNSASVFLLVQQKNDGNSAALLEEQVDICKRVLNIYRYAVMNTRMDHKTWEQLLVVMLHVTSKVLDQPAKSSKQLDSLGAKLASALFQTLIVSWVKASLNVPITLDLWDQFMEVLSRLTYIDDLISEWAKTMETLTRVLARHLYNLDLANLPLDRLTEQKAKIKRGLQSDAKELAKQAVVGSEGDQSFPRKRNASSGSGANDRTSLPFVPRTPIPQRSKLVMRRSVSEGNLLTPKKDKLEISKLDRANEGLENVRKRKFSRSFDTLGRMIAKDITILTSASQYTNLQSEWAEISSSAASLENNNSSINMDGDANSVSVMEPSNELSKEEAMGIITGGNIKGWLPSVAAVLWRRMLGVLGNPNKFSNPKSHAHFFQVLNDMWSTLFKMRLNQCVSLDNTSTPKPAELVPPLTIIMPWCLEAMELPENYNEGKVLACSLLCEITLTNEDISLSHEYLCKFYAALHRHILSNKQEIINEIVRKCGIKFVPKTLPGFSVLALDLIQTAHSVLSCEHLLKSVPRMEAATMLGSVLAIAGIFTNVPVLKPNSMQFQPIQSQQTKEIVLSCLAQVAKRERTALARAIVLQALTIFLAQEFTEIRHTGFPPQNANISPNEYKRRLNEIFLVLLECLKVENRNVAMIASDLLAFLSEFASEVSTYLPEQCARIILGLKQSLQHVLPSKVSSRASGRPPEMEKRLIISLILTLGEWSMKLPMQNLLSSDFPNLPETPLLCIVFEALLMVTKGRHENENKPAQFMEGFEPNIPFDDLQVLDSVKTSDENSFARPAKLSGLENETVKLAARTMMLHLLTQLGHFPISNSAERCSSTVMENDDLAKISSELDEFSSRIFTLPNLQMFTLDNETLVSFVELPLSGMSGDCITSGFQSARSQVRIIVRDLSGKASWDASHLISPPSSTDEVETVLLQPNFNEDLFYQSAITGSFFPAMGPRLTLRRRPLGTLPTVEDSAEDLDNLDDLLSYIGYTSPECQLRVGESLITPWGPPPSISQEVEDDIVSAVVNQRNAELEYLVKTDLDPLMRARPVHSSEWLIDDTASENLNSESSYGISSKMNSISSCFLLSRKLFSQLGLNGWDKRSSVHLLNKDEKLLRELKHLDSQKCRESHKIAVIYVAEGQEDKQSILYNSGGSETYEEFVSGLGWEVELETHTGFMGGLQKNKSTGETAPYYASSFVEVMFHVATRMPSNSDESLLQKTRHLGNDEVHIVWSEHKRDYRRDIIPTEFCDVLIVIYPIQYGLFRIQIIKKPEVPYFGPLYNGAIVNRDVLAPLVRATAINASRAKRSSLHFFQHHFQERAKSLSTIIQNHKLRTTFEQFTTNTFSPKLPTSFQPGTAHRASATSFSSSSRASVPTIPSNQLLASALVDHVFHNVNPAQIRSANSPVPSISSLYQEINFSQNQELNGNHSEDKNLTDNSPPQPQPIPPVPPRRFSVKLGSALKPKLHTPPASPLVPRISPPRPH